MAVAINPSRKTSVKVVGALVARSKADTVGVKYSMEELQLGGDDGRLYPNRRELKS
ncbi:hypothetical protein [Coleofasciculus chthonoplastes]|uniref:hypothetical protein n=1 Tax=Coleofasciculus chthonoplastes TaxID=64178 RepID=UPI0032F9DBAE